MLYKTHLVFGLITGILIANFLNIKIDLIFFIIIFFASLFPDLDEKNSKLGKNFKIISFIFEHRGLLHSIWFNTLISLLIYDLINTNYAILFFGVYLSHIIADGLTKAGVKPFYPINVKISGNIKVGGFMEKLFFLLLVLVLGILFYYENFNLVFFH